MNKEKYNSIINDSYETYSSNSYKEEYNRLSQNGLFEIDLEWVGFTKEEFINKCKTDPEFSEKWGLKIEERELTRLEIIQLGIKSGWKPKDFIENFEHEDLNGWNIPTKLITLIYNNETIENYE